MADDFLVIAEIKFASFTEPHLGKRSDLISRAKQYEQAGADAISLIIEQRIFKGDLSDIAKVKKHVSLPILVKDFVLDESQIYQIKQAGADRVLLIAKIVSGQKLKRFVKLSKVIGLEPVVEINDEQDLKKAMATDTNIIAVNARNLKTLRVDVDGACRLLAKIPQKFIKLGFSGIHSRVEVVKYKRAGAKGVLVGTALMKTQNINQFIKELKTLVQVKICGIRTVEAAQAAVDAGADFLGFNFVPSSKRYIDPKSATEIINYIRGKIKIVGVFQNSTATYVNKTASDLGLDLVQLHGNEDNGYINKIKIPVIKAIQINDKPEAIQAAYFLLDRPNRKGRSVNLEKAAQLALKFDLFFAGGLNPDNVDNVIRRVRPFAVDVAGGIEKNGMQDIQKIKKFIKNAKGEL